MCSGNGEYLIVDYGSMDDNGDPKLIYCRSDKELFEYMNKVREWQRKNPDRSGIAVHRLGEYLLDWS